MPTVLVTGGAGYIGSHTVLRLTERGYRVIVYDNLSSGHAEAVLAPAELIRGDLAETHRLERIISEESVDSIVHFAADIVVPESVSNPLKYYRNNTINTTNLIELAARSGIQRFVFSSTAAVYGIPDSIPVSEDAPVRPINPYGRSKLMSEWVLRDVCHAEPRLTYMILRYFNVAGADPEGRIGQSTPEATHLIKAACQAALGSRSSLPIYGTDYPTPDGTGVRDYIHVTDLADVHLLALQHLEQGSPSGVYNCGYGHGYSVRQIVEAVQRASGARVPVEEAARRPGDPAELVADPARVKTDFGWRPRFDDIDAIVGSAYAWERDRRF
jgi:UDP-glucose 4-epimerase